ncbi:acyloxyacyl hydrolase [Luteimonas sp. MC1782]|uniref:acyloxyacyl hydrolase n=1 Tax=Luteimonas sp. MC1782 TaxID=2760305 RepID=UPI0015FEEF5F|nr:acyloxyacyl hydrolase [Luteimonas sp. MC1782]
MLGLAPGLAPARESPDVEVALGASNTTDREFTAVASVAWLPELRRMSNAVLRAEAGAVLVDGRGHVVGRDLDESVVVGHVGLRYERTDNGLTLGAGVGGQAGETDALSGDVQFITTGGWRWERFSLLVRHISNASLDSPNDGETMLVAAWRF